MIEIKRSSAWHSPYSMAVASENLTAREEKLLAERAEIIKRAQGLITHSSFGGGYEGYVWLKITKGIFKGTVFKAYPGNGGWQDSPQPITFRLDLERVGDGFRNYELTDRQRENPTKGFVAADRMILYVNQGELPINFKNGSIYPEFLGSDITSTCALLLDYEGDAELVIDTKKRPLTFTDRLGQDVSIGDLVVVALNQGAGLDICTVRGFCDEDRVVIESVDTGNFDRITIENNETNKIMRMPNNLRDTALMLKLSKD